MISSKFSTNTQKNENWTLIDFISLTELTIELSLIELN